MGRKFAGMGEEGGSGGPAAEEGLQMRLGPADEFPLEEDYEDERLRRTRDQYGRAEFDKGEADEAKRHATQVARIQTRRLAYYEVLLAVEMARCESLKRPGAVFAAMDVEDAPKVVPLGEWRDLTSRTQTEGVLYAIFRDGSECTYSEACDILDAEALRGDLPEEGAA